MSFNSPLGDTFYLSVCFLLSLPVSPIPLSSHPSSPLSLPLLPPLVPSLFSHPSVSLSVSFLYGALLMTHNTWLLSSLRESVCVCVCVCVQSHILQPHCNTAAVCSCSGVTARANHWHFYIYFTLRMNYPVHLCCNTLVLEICRGKGPSH